MSAPYGDTTGYSFTEGALKSIAGQLRDAEKALDGVTSNVVRGVDAGASSAIVGTVLDDLVKMGVGAAGAAGGAAEKVHAANGAYDDIENTHAGQLKLNDKHADDPDTQRETHVHG
ncbi:MULTISPECIES: hypothetical protein [unclassified Amycolatopsis]|uniref:hypothetical protein n=1 Tax=unclassified Amycolatopsis TaxID=2618356 RepID=UPI000562479A|nr:MULTISPECIES: hypothetical protein [unclassified Amycolatopsis]MCG3751721.1 hypothetical protein [Amycolatopsis sp. Poz14]